MRKPHPYVLVGFLLGWGAPLGALLMRYAWSEHLAIYAWTSREIQNHFLLYTYMTVSTAVVFALFGSWMESRMFRFKRRILALEHSSEELNELSMTDGLTGLYNHRYLHERLELELQRSDRYQSPLALLMIDIDDFKLLNDTCGHLFGDYALKHLASVLMQFTRKIDIVGRYGGEEFLLILPQTTEEMGLRVAERIRQAAAAMDFKPETIQAIHLTVTIGVVSLPRVDIATSASAIQAADNALYVGKRHGKNRVEISRGLVAEEAPKGAHHA